ncbi:MAG: T9SS type A sorting domain-containing protein [Bacteroidota bacterium]|nr:T9SS type A sorting domain-containing protein [Bacteroidota bacterium]
MKKNLYLIAFLILIVQYSQAHQRFWISPSADTIPLTELGLGTWKNSTGGLYAHGKNERPYTHDSSGVVIAKEIVPLDTLGNLDEVNGRIVLLSIGMSNTTQEYSAFKTLADTFSLKNPKVTVVDGAQGGQTASIIKNPNANFWNVINQRLTQQRVRPLQVQTVWLKEANSNPMAAFPKHADDLKSDLKIIVKVLKSKFPNLKLVYLSSRTYGGYATTTLNPEPYAYESGFSVKWLIDEQINGDTSLGYTGTSAVAPWLSWGPYLWAKGTTPRQDGLVWLRNDFVADGTHPSTSGRLKVANMLLNFFSSDSSTVPWFIKKTITSTSPDYSDEISNKPIVLMQNYPNPFSVNTLIKWKSRMVGKTTLTIHDINGIEVCKLLDESTSAGEHEINFNNTELPPGIYFYKIQINRFSDSKRMVLME